MKVEGDLRAKISAQLADSDSNRIINATLREPKTVLAICKELDLPMSTVYRKVGELRSCGLLVADKILVREDGKREVAYVCSFTQIVFRVKGEEIEMEVVLTERGKEGEWFRLFFPKAASGSPERA